ncbi:MAG: energy transducer TonB [Saprospiraceae bacterium]
MKKERKPESFFITPSYPGGNKAMLEFLKSQLQIPEEARKAGIEGTVRVRLDIDFRGKVTGAHVVNHLGYGCDEEAVRVVHLLKFDVPRNRGVKTIYHKTINIHFKQGARQEAAVPVQPTPPAMPVPESPSVQYTVVSSPAKKPTQKKDGYSYNISI